MPDFIFYIFGGVLYSVSPKFRKKKKVEWQSKSELYKTYEIGMWVSMPIFGLLFAVVALVK